jgi:hypothetical protein
MTNQAWIALLGPILFALVIVWFVLIKLLFNRLERSHSTKYESMGRPSLFLRNNISTGFATMKFLFGREHRLLGDGYLSKLSDFMLVYLLIYAALFVFLAFHAPR